MILFNILYILSNSFTASEFKSIFDQTFGPLGGILTGLFIGLIIMTRFRGAVAYRSGSYETNVKYVGMGLTFVYFALCLGLFFGLKRNSYLTC